LTKFVPFAHLILNLQKWQRFIHYSSFLSHGEYASSSIKSKEEAFSPYNKQKDDLFAPVN
jgi:hypothetical protein